MPPRRPPSPDSLTYAILYCRVSTLEQASEGVSLAAQLAECRRYAGALGWLIGAEYADVLSGMRDQRPQYQALLQDCRTRRAEGQVVVVVVMRLDRFGRRILERVRSRDELKRLGVPLHSVREGGEVSDIVANVLAAVAEEEVRQIAERTSSAKQHISRQGWFPGGRPPWGYLLRDATLEERAHGAPRRVLDVDPVAAPFVQDAIARLVAGASLHAVAQWVATLPSAARSGRALGWTRLRGYLESEALRGLHHGAPARWPALVDAATACLLDARLARWGRGQRQPPGRYLLTGLLRCPRCSAALAGSAGYAGRQASYRCFDWRARQSAHGMRCTFGVLVAPTDAAVLAAVSARLAPITTRDRAAQRRLAQAWQALRQPAPVASDVVQQRALARARDQAEARLRTAALRLVDGTLGEAAYRLVCVQAEADLTAATVALAAAPTTAPTLFLPPWEQVRQVGVAWEAVTATAELAPVRLLLLDLVDSVTPQWLGRGRAAVTVAWTGLGEMLGAL